MILSIDFGTSSVKAAVLSESFQILASENRAYSYHIYNADWVELDIATVWKAMLDCIHAFSEYSSQIDLVCYDTFSPSVLLMDRNGDALCPIITHLDRRSREQSDEIIRQIGFDAFLAETGTIPYPGGTSVTTLLWLQKYAPALFSSAFCAGHLNTYIHHQMTGQFVIDPTNASMTGLFETCSTRGWSKPLLSSFHIDEALFPPVIEAGSLFGTITSRFAKQSGLREGVPVAVGTNDAAIAQVAANNNSAGCILNISGSSEIISILTNKPYPDKRYYLRLAAQPGLWQIFAITAGGFMLEWIHAQFYRDLNDTDFFTNEYACAAKLAEHPLSVKMEPYFAGDRQSLEKKYGSFSGMSLETTRRDLFAALLRGIHEPICSTISLVSNVLPLERTVKVTGGMITPEYLQLKEALLQGYAVQYSSCGSIIGNAVWAYKHLLV